MHSRKEMESRRAAARRGLPAQLAERDRAILRDLVRFGALTRAQVGGRHVGSPTAASRPLARLVAAGYVAPVRVWYRGPGVYVATRLGARAAHAGLAPARLAFTTLAHQLAVADLAHWLLEQEPTAHWITERELRRDAMAAARARGYGWLVDGVPHIPDGLLVGRDGRTAVELERSTKRQLAYQRIVRWYAGTPDYDRLRWFVTTEALRRRLEALAQRHGLADLMAVERLPAAVHLPDWR